MNDQTTELVPQTESENSLALPNDGELQLVAYSKEQMESAQQQLLAWCDRKVADADADAKLKEASDAKTSALAGNFSTAPFHRLWQRARKEVEFYEKIRTAIENGYVIMPNLPLDIFAVRTCRSKPRALESSHRDSLHRQHSESPPAGEGEYVDSIPVQHSYTYEEEKPGTTEMVTKRSYLAGEFAESIDFPLSVAKPVIMDRVIEAMQHKIFDEIGVLPNRQTKKKDPIVAGVIRRPGDAYGDRSLQFLLAWYIDTKVL